MSDRPEQGDQGHQGDQAGDGIDEGGRLRGWLRQAAKPAALGGGGAALGGGLPLLLGYVHPLIGAVIGAAVVVLMFGESRPALFVANALADRMGQTVRGREARRNLRALSQVPPTDLSPERRSNLIEKLFDYERDPVRRRFGDRHTEDSKRGFSCPTPAPQETPDDKPLFETEDIRYGESADEKRDEASPVSTAIRADDLHQSQPAGPRHSGSRRCPNKCCGKNRRHQSP